MTIAAILRNKGSEVIALAPDARVSEAVALFAERGIGAAPVVEGGRVAGIFSERDVITRLASDGAAVMDWPIGRAMTSPAITVTPDSPVLFALSLMTRQRIRHLPVLQGETMVGLVSIGDLVKFRIDRIEEEAAAMRDYIQGA